MISIDRILFPVDFSERCTEMIPYLKVMAAQYRSELILLHVVNPVCVVPEAGLWPPTALSLREWLLSQQAEKLEEFARKEWEDFPVRRLVLEGEPEAQILATAQAENVQLVVMPTHGYGRFRRLLLGSVTAKVLHDLERPVLTGAHRSEHPLPAHAKISHVVCALDLGPRSGDTLTWANRLATDFHATLSLVHVAPPIDPSLKIVFSSEVRAERDAVLREEIGQLQITVAAKDSTVCLVQGDVPPAVCSYAQSVGAALLVIGRGARGEGLGRLRANTYAIIRQSSCPVLSV